MVKAVEQPATTLAGRPGFGGIIAAR